MKFFRLLVLTLLLSMVLTPLAAFADGDPLPNGGWPHVAVSVPSQR
jgi:hypothetical protein